MTLSVVEEPGLSAALCLRRTDAVRDLPQTAGRRLALIGWNGEKKVTLCHGHRVMLVHTRAENRYMRLPIGLAGGDVVNMEPKCEG